MTVYTAKGATMWRVDAQTMASVLSRADAAGLVTSDDTTVVFYDLDQLHRRLDRIRDVFPANAMHAVAIKANPIRSVLAEIVERGFGLEAASLPEVRLALSVGASPDRIFFDSPAKTHDELRMCLKTGVRINADNVDELDRIERLIGELQLGWDAVRIGLRINPQVGRGAIASTSVATRHSKFGVPIARRADIIERFVRHRWLTGLHAHVGSQGGRIDSLVDSAELLFDLAIEIESQCPADWPGVRTIDLGGGLSVPYRPHETHRDVGELVAAMRERRPGLLDGSREIGTEFGRWVHANTGWIATRVEYVKSFDGVHTLVVHAGADILLREAYNPDDWFHAMDICRDGVVVSDGPPVEYQVAGPLCFSGDFVSRSVRLPRVQSGDTLLIHDCGAYTLAMWSTYNSRQSPKVIGYRPDRDPLSILRDRASIESVINFWG